MASYKLSQVVKEDLMRIHHYGIEKFGQIQADIYFDTFFDYFEIIDKQPFSFESIEFIRKGYRRCVCSLIVSTSELLIMVLKSWQSLGYKISINDFDTIN